MVQLFFRLGSAPSATGVLNERETGLYSQSQLVLYASSEYLTTAQAHVSRILF